MTAFDWQPAYQSILGQRRGDRHQGRRSLVFRHVRQRGFQVARAARIHPSTAGGNKGNLQARLSVQRHRGQKAAENARRRLRLRFHGVYVNKSEQLERVGRVKMDTHKTISPF